MATTININVAATPYYKLSQYAIGCKVGQEQTYADSSTARLTADGKTHRQLVAECGFSMAQPMPWWHGTPTTPSLPKANTMGIQRDCVANGGVIFEMLSGWVESVSGSAYAPEDARALSAATAGDQAYAPSNIKAWVDYWVGQYGAAKVKGLELYNEPANMVAPSFRGGWYSSSVGYGVGKDDARLSADWATNHQKDYADPLMAAYPNLLVGGMSHSSGGQDDSGEWSRFVNSYSGALVSANVPHMRLLTKHGYGPFSGMDTQSWINAAFQNAWSVTTTGRQYGHRKALQTMRAILDAAGGTSIPIMETEWWVLNGANPGSYNSSSLQTMAFGDVWGAIIHTKFAAEFKFEAMLLWAFSPRNAWLGSSGTPANGAAPTFFDVVDGVYALDTSVTPQKIWRQPRHYSARDMIVPFMKNHRNLIANTYAASPDTVSSTTGGTVNSIQAATAISDDGTKLAILAINCDRANAATVTFSWGVASTGSVTGVILPNSLGLDTPLTTATPGSTGSTSYTVTLDAKGAIYLEVPISGSPPPPPPPPGPTTPPVVAAESHTSLSVAGSKLIVDVQGDGITAGDVLLAVVHASSTPGSDSAPTSAAYDNAVLSLGTAVIKRFLKLNETSGTSIADSSGNGIAASTAVGGFTLGEPSLLAAQPTETSIRFNGSTGKINLTGIDLSTSGDAEVECILKLNSLPAAGQKAGVVGAEIGGLSFVIGDDGKMWATIVDTQDAALRSAVALSTGVTYHLKWVWIRASKAVNYYIDGKYQGTGTFTVNPTAGKLTNVIAARKNQGGTSDQFLDGWISRVAIAVSQTSEQDTQLHSDLAHDTLNTQWALQTSIAEMNNSGSQQNGRLLTYTKVASAADAGRKYFAWWIPTSSFHQAAVVRITGADGTVEAAAGIANGSALAYIDCPSLTLTKYGTLLVCVASQANATTFSVPGSMTEIVDDATLQSPAFPAGDRSIEIAAEPISNPGATGTRRITDQNPNGVQYDRMTGHSIAINASASQPAAPTPRRRRTMTGAGR